MKNIDIKSLTIIHDGDIHDYEVGFHYVHWFNIYIAVRELEEALERAGIFAKKEAENVGGAGYEVDNKKYYTVAQLFDLVSEIEARAEKAGYRGVTVVIK